MKQISEIRWPDRLFAFYADNTIRTPYSCFQKGYRQWFYMIRDPYAVSPGMIYMVDIINV